MLQFYPVPHMLYQLQKLFKLIFIFIKWSEDNINKIGSLSFLMLLMQLKLAGAVFSQKVQE